ncbi:MAG: spore coat protein CotH, partial [Bacteroidia bacterium]
MRYILAFLFISTKFVFGQVLYNPQELYDAPGGLFDMDSLRTIDIDFYDPNFHQILVDGWENQTGQRLPATLTLSNGELADSVAIRYKGNSTFAIANNNNNPKLPLNLDMNQLVIGQ